MKSLAPRTQLFSDSVFGQISQLAQKHQAINLSQGFPDFDGDPWPRSRAQFYIENGYNQYAPFPGHPELRKAISHYYQHFYQLNYDAQEEITITVGATEAIFLTVMALVSPGDEVIIFEPFYDSYVSAIKLAGGIPVPITLRGINDFSFDPQELRKKINQKTQLIIFNNPHNPTGKVFNSKEVAELAQICVEFDLYLLSDEVYEFLIFDQVQHRPSAKFIDMKERTLTISSAGKIFGMTGWKIGWVCASHAVSKAIRKLHQYITFSVATPLQLAVADGLQLDFFKNYIDRFKQDYQELRDIFYRGLKDLNWYPYKCEGTYFMMVDITSISHKKSSEFALELIQKYKIAAIPPQSFYLESKEGEKYLRFCFAKNRATLEKALLQLKMIKPII